MTTRTATLTTAVEHLRELDDPRGVITTAIVALQAELDVSLAEEATAGAGP